MREPRLEKKRSRPMPFPLPRWIRGVVVGNLQHALFAFAILLAGAAPGCQKNSKSQPAPTTQKTASSGTKTVAAQLPSPAAPVSQDTWTEGNAQERASSMAPESCDVGKPGCTCLPGYQCSGDAECYWGFCYGEGFPAPETYRYTHNSRTDYYHFHKLILSELRLGPVMRIADIGAGVGKYAFPIADLLGSDSTIYATDIDPNAFARLTKNTTNRKTTHPDSAVVEPLLVKHTRDTGLDALPDNHLDLILMINSVVFYRAESPEADNKYLMSLLGKLKPGGRLIYHVDWIQTHNGLQLKESIAYFQKAGFSPEPRVIPMPKHIPESTYDVQYSPEGSQQRMPLDRGFILEFIKGSGP